MSKQKAKQCDPGLQWHMFHAICRMHRKAKEDVLKHLDMYMIDSGEEERIETDILGPKNVQKNIPEVIPIIKARKIVTPTLVADTLSELYVIPDNFDSIQ